MAFILVVFEFASSGFIYYRTSRCAPEFFGGLVQADDRPLRVVGTLIDIKHILHLGDITC
jgi:hypothetical protein